MIHASVAVLVREIRVQLRYPMSMINLVLLTPLYEMAIPTLLLGTAFLVDGSATGLATMAGTSDMPGWIGLGLLVASLMTGALIGVSGTIQSDRQTGVLEHSWASPASREVFVLGAVAVGVFFTSLACALLLAFNVLLLGASYDPGGLLWSVPILGALLVAVCGYGYMAGAASLVLRRPGALLMPLGTIVATFSGVAFPLTVLPEPLRLPSMLLPTTWSLDLLRQQLLHTHLLASPGAAVAALIATSLGWLLVGRWLFMRADSHVRRSGKLTQF